MKHLGPALAFTLLAAAVAPAAAQAPDTSSPAPLAPRVEVGGGFTSAIAVPSEGEGAALLAMVNAKVGVAVSRRWSLEGVFDIWPESNGSTTLYRAQALWRLGGASSPGSLQTHLTMGAAGWFSHESSPEYRWQDASGTEYVYPARSYWNAGPPIYPSVGFGLQKALGAHLAFRADVALVLVPYDDGATFVVMPSVGVSVPIGRYPRTSH